MVEEGLLDDTDFGAPVVATDEDADEVLTYSLRQTGDNAGNDGLFDTAYFAIHPSTGQLRTRAVFDYETKNRWIFKVRVEDRTGRADEIKVIVEIIDVVEVAVLVKLDTVFFEVGETVTATIQGLPTGTTVRWRWERSTDKITWRGIPGASSNRYTQVDADVGHNLRVGATYTNAGGAEVTEYKVGAATVGRPPAPPTFASSSRTIRVAAGTGAGNPVGNPITADGDGSFVYELSGIGSDSFTIDSTGQISAAQRLTSPRYSIVVTVSTLFGSDTIDVTIIVDQEGTLTLSRTQAGVPINASLSDPNGATGPTWRWEKSSDGTTGWTVIAGARSDTYTPVAADVGSYLRVTVNYTDGHGPGKSLSVVTGPVTEGNAAPVFASASTTRSVEENTAGGRNIGAPVAATDANGDPLIYTLSGSDAGSFDIGRMTGQLMTKAPLDYETKNSYSVTVTATDPSGASDTVTVTIAVTNVNERGKIRLSSLQPRVGTGLTASFVSGGDGGASAQTWQWQRGDLFDPWVAITGATSATYRPAAADVGSYLRVEATYTDGSGASVTIGAITDSRVRDAPDGDARPEFARTEDTRRVEENTHEGQNIGARVAATDPNGDALTYMLGGDDAGSFDINPGTGQLMTKAPLDYEAKSSYSVTVTATDPSDESDTITVTIMVADVNEPGVVTFSTESPRAGAEMSAFIADVDGGTEAPYTFTWERSEDGLTGWTLVQGGFNNRYTPRAADGGSYLRVTVTYSDRRHGPGQTAEGVTANPVEGSNAAPVFPGGARTITVEENTGPGVDFGDPVAATDSDARDEGRLVYELGGLDGTSFDIDSMTGQLSTKEALNYEGGQPNYSLTVRATDTSNAQASVRVTVEVTNVEEAGVVALSSQQHHVGIEITATLRDPDGDIVGETWQWQISAGGTTGWTDITGTTSDSHTPVAADVGNFLRAMVSYGDGHGPNKTAASDPSENAVHVNTAPMFPAATATRMVPEGAAFATMVGDPLVAEDLDPGDTLTYSLRDTDEEENAGDSENFRINRSTGQLRSVAELDFESRASYTFVVVAVDRAGAEAIVTVTVEVTNADEGDGRVTLSALYPQVGVELDPDGHTVDDPDGRVSNEVWGWERAMLALDNWETIIGAESAAYTPVDGDVGYLLRVKVTYDGLRAPVVYALTEETVREANTGNMAPAFAGNTAGRNVDEGTAAGEDIGEPVTATDGDDDPLTYALGGDDAASFDLNPATGQLMTKAPLDYEAKSSYSVTVTATDPSGASDTITVNIMVNDVGAAVSGPLANQFDEDDDDEIAKVEAINAIRAYFNGEINKEDAIDIIRLYFASA